MHERLVQHEEKAYDGCDDTMAPFHGACPWLAGNETKEHRVERVTLSLLKGWKGIERVGIAAGAP